MAIPEKNVIGKSLTNVGYIVDQRRNSMEQDRLFCHLKSSKRFPFHLLKANNLRKRVMKITIWALFGMLATAVYGYAQPLSLPLAARVNTQILVPSNPVWTDTGLTLAPGDIVSITASGSWNWREGFFGPDGDPSGGCCHFDDFQHFDDYDKGRLIAFVGVDPYQGHWGDASFFPQPSGYISVGSAQTFTTTVGGKLWLGFNDAAVTMIQEDNFGSVTANIILLRSLATMQGDLDGDGKADLVWRNLETGDVAAWLMDGVVLKQLGLVYAGVPLTWQIQ